MAPAGAGAIPRPRPKLLYRSFPSFDIGNRFNALELGTGYYLVRMLILQYFNTNGPTQDEHFLYLNPL